MLRELIFYSLMAISLIHIIHVGLYIVGANIYDIKRYRIGATQAKRKSRAKKPLVSVIIPAYNEQSSIKRTLDSILASSYKNIEVIVIDDGSKDKTKSIVRKYISSLGSTHKTKGYNGRHGRNGNLVRRFGRTSTPRTSVRIKLVAQSNSGKGAAVNNGIVNHARGSLIMTLDADSELHTNAIENAVHYFRDRSVVGVAANVQVIDNHTMLGVLQKIEHLIGYRSKKFYTVANCEMIVGGVASTYRATTLNKLATMTQIP